MDTLIIYYDGQCPLCLAEILLLRARNRRGLLSFEDVSDPAYADSAAPVSCAAALEQIHGRLGDGTVLAGPAVFAEAYRRADLGLLAWLMSRRWLSPALNAAYRFFARHRHAISRVIGPPLLRIARRRYR